MSIRYTNGKWIVDASVKIDGKLIRKRKQAAVQTEAGAWHEHDYLVSLLAAGEDANVDPDITFGAFIDTIVRKRVASTRASSKSQVRANHLALLRYVPAALPLKEIGQRHYDIAMAGFSDDGLAPTTIKKYSQVFLSLLRTEAVTMGYLPAPVVLRKWKFKAQRQYIEPLDDDDVRVLLDYAEGQMRAMILVTLETGVRAAELRALQWCDINWEQRTLLVRRTEHQRHFYPTKGSIERLVPLSEAAYSMLRHRMYADLHDGQLKSALIFPARTGMPYRASLLSRALRGVYQATGVGARMAPGYRPWHILRHTFATRLFRGGAEVPTIQRLLGHARIETTMEYLHVNEEDCKNAISLLPNLPSLTATVSRAPSPASERNAAVLQMPVERIAYR